MPGPTCDEFLELVRKSGLVTGERLQGFVEELSDAPSDPKRLAAQTVAHGLLTYFQAQQLLLGKWRGFQVGKYKILERLGSGGMGIVYLCEHTIMGRQVAVKVLPVSLAKDPWFLQNFYKEAQAVAALSHPNIVHAHDIDQSGDLHFLVMEYVDGSSLQEIGYKHGPLSILRAAHYISQAAKGLQHAHERGVVHRDIKPGNLLLDRQGTIKILDMGLAHFFRRQKVEKKDEPKTIVGTGDYLAPEQVVDSDDVDIRADIYGLGATFYFLLTGKPPFHEASTDYHKLLWHLARSPKPVRELRPEIPEDLAKVVDRMIAKNPWDRYQVPVDIVKALAPWTRQPIPPPPEEEMPRLSLAARRALPEGRQTTPATPQSWAIVRQGASPTPSPAASSAETQRVTPGENSSVTLSESGEQNSSLMRACVEAEKKK